MRRRYAELHCRSSFSFLAGASHPRELVLAAGALGLDELAITDIGGVYGVVRAWEARRKLLEAHQRGEVDEHNGEPIPRPPRLIYGAELPLDPLPRRAQVPPPTNRAQVPPSTADVEPSDALLVLVRDGVGWSKLTQAITRGRRRVDKGELALTQRELRRLGGDHWCVIAGGPRSRLLRLLRQGEVAAAQRELAALKEAFGDALSVELTRHLRPGDHERSLALAALAAAVSVPCVATNDVFFHADHRKKLHDVLTCIRLGVSLGEAGRRLQPNAERRLKDHATMAALFSDLPEAVERAGELAARCRFALDELSYSYPEEAVPPGETADEYLGRLARRGLVARLGTRRAAELRERLERELSIIAELRYAGYFLTMWEVVRFCGREGILCQGRGSAANSLVCYATGITSVSPDQIDMLFERFVSLERKEPPDIDLDIEHDRREEVLQHVYDTYGRDKAAMVCSVITYRHRSAIRDVGKVLGFDDQTLARVTRYVASGMGYMTAPQDDRAARQESRDGASGESVEPTEQKRGSVIRDEAAVAAGLDPRSRSWQQLLLLSELLIDFPRHLSIHTGGFLLSRDAVAKLVPVENGRMVDRTVIQWDKDDIDALGLFKVDLLGLGMLNVIARAFAFIERHHGLELDLGAIPPDDRETYAMIQAADTIGVFQIESRAQMNMLPRLEPRDFYDLVIEVALVRPGPIQGGMVHPFLRRRRGEEPADVPHPALEPILGRTLGVPIFQEQVMRVAVAVGGYTPGEADQLRRDMAAWRRAGNMARHQKRLRESMAARGIEPSFADRIIQQIEGFGSYGFPESHAAAFAHLVYISAYLKCHFPAEFAAALIDAQPMGFYQISSIVADAHRHGVPIEGVCVQKSSWGSTIIDRELEPNILRLGLKLVRGLREEDGRRVVAERIAGGTYRSVSELARRCKLERKALDALALAGAFRSLTRGRREAVWQAAALGGNDLVANLDAGDRDYGDGQVRFAPLSEADELRLDYAHAQSFIERHPLNLYRQRLRRAGVLRSIDLLRARPGSLVKVAGLVIVRQRPGGGKMIFMALEDETGLVDLAVNLDIFARYRSVIMLAEVLYAEGTLQLDGRARSVLARSFRNISGRVGGVRSRDFH